MTPNDLAVTPAEALALTQRLLDTDRPFHAHEVLEAVWKSADPDERELWRGLAQLAVGLTHLRRGNPRGAVALLTRGADRLAQFAARYRTQDTVGENGPTEPYGLDLKAIVTTAHELATTIDHGETGPASPVRFRLTD